MKVIGIVGSPRKNGNTECERNFKDAIKEYGEEIEVYDITEIAFHAL